MGLDGDLVGAPRIAGSRHHDHGMIRIKNAAVLAINDQQPFGSPGGGAQVDLLLPTGSGQTHTATEPAGGPGTAPFVSGVHALPAQSRPRRQIPMMLARLGQIHGDRLQRLEAQTGVATGDRLEFFRDLAVEGHGRSSPVDIQVRSPSQ